MTTWIAILAVAAGSYVFRFLPLLVLGGRDLPPFVDGIARHGGTAAIAALIATQVASGSTGTADALAAVLALVASGAVALAGRGLVTATVAGVATFVALDPLINALTTGGPA